MSREDRVIRIKLNDEQRKQIRTATGVEADALQLSVEELEERINPIPIVEYPPIRP